MIGGRGEDGLGNAGNGQVCTALNLLVSVEPVRGVKSFRLVL